MIKLKNTTLIEVDTRVFPYPKCHLCGSTEHMTHNPYHTSVPWCERCRRYTCISCGDSHFRYKSAIGVDRDFKCVNCGMVYDSPKSWTYRVKTEV